MITLYSVALLAQTYDNVGYILSHLAFLKRLFLCKNLVLKYGVPGACKQYFCHFTDLLWCREDVRAYAPLAFLTKNSDHCYTIKLVECRLLYHCCIQIIRAEDTCTK